MLDLIAFNRLKNNNLPTSMIQDSVYRELSTDTPLWLVPCTNITINCLMTFHIKYHNK